MNKIEASEEPEFAKVFTKKDLKLPIGIFSKRLLRMFQTKAYYNSGITHYASPESHYLKLSISEDMKE